MPDLATSIEHLADLELYETEKPYCILLSSEDVPDGVPTDNLVFTRHDTVVRDIRGNEDDYVLEKSGFTLLNHSAQSTNFKTLHGLQQYQEETQVLLGQHFDAECVVTWDVKARNS